MNRLRKPKNLSLWYLFPVALGLHGLVLLIPIDVNKPADKPQSAPMKLVPLLKQPSPLATAPKPIPAKATIVTPKLSPRTPVARMTPVASQRSPALVLPKPKPAPATATAKPTPKPSPDVFQIQGAIACDGIKDCYASSETKGRLVSQTLEQQLQAKGYVLEPLDLDEGRSTSMKIYHLIQNGQPKDYLHIIWTDQGTRSLRLPQPVTDREELAAKAGLLT